MRNQWTISGAGGGRDGAGLVGCHIRVSDDGQHYEFRAHFPQTLSTTTGSSLPATPFSFPRFNWELPGVGELSWTITVDTLTGGGGHNLAQGRWGNTDPFSPDPTQDESGTWTAQAGQGEEGDGEEDAAAASSGSY